MIPRELVKKLRKIEIHTARLANDQLAGGYHSVFKGRGMAFSEVRQYQPGDDVRFIDWNVSARMTDPYVKVFSEEREMTVMLVVDLSESGLFGTAGIDKRRLATEVAALCAFSAAARAAPRRGGLRAPSRGGRAHRRARADRLAWYLNGAPLNGALNIAHHSKVRHYILCTIKWCAIICCASLNV